MILTLTVFRVSSVTSSMTLAVALLLLSSTSVILTDTRSRRSSLLLLRVSNSVKPFHSLAIHNILFLDLDSYSYQL